MIQRTTDPVANVDEVKVLLLVPAFTPFTCHWYEGAVPPLTGVAVNVTATPGHVGFVPAVCAMLTEGVTEGATEMVIAFEVAGLAVTPAKLDVITHETTCPAVSEEVV
jgi:hypothetical protein